MSHHVPKGWRSVRLSEVATVVSGATPKSSVSSYWNGNIPWIGPADLSKLARREISRGARNITAEGYASCAARLVPAGAVVMSSRAPIGYLAIAANELCTSQGCKTFVPSSELDSRFLYWRLKCDLPEIISMGSGNTFTEVSGSKLAAKTIVFPGLDEQRRIANRLDVAMAKIAVARPALDRQLKDCTHLTFALIAEVLRGRAIATNNEEDQQGDGWVALTQVARLESGHTPSRKRPEWWGGDVPWMALPDIRALDGTTAEATAETTNDLGLANSSARLLPAGTVVLSRTASVGFVAVMGKPMATSQDFVNWVPGAKLRSWYLAYALINARDYLRRLSSGAVHKTIYMPTLKTLHIRLPSVDEQDQMIERIQSAHALADETRASIKEQSTVLDALPASLLNAAFRGEI